MAKAIKAMLAGVGGANNGEMAGGVGGGSVATEQVKLEGTGLGLVGLAQIVCHVAPASLIRRQPPLNRRGQMIRPWDK